MARSCRSGGRIGGVHRDLSAGGRATRAAQ